MLRNYFKIAFRNLRRQPGYTAINIVGLAVGMAACLLIGLYVRHELSYDAFHEKGERIHRVNLQSAPQRGMNRQIAITPNIVAPLMTRTFPAVEKSVRLYKRSGVVQHADRAFQEDRFFFADSTFFDIFDFEFVAGQPETALARPNSVVLTEATAQRIFPDDNPLGQTLVRNTDTEYEVTGVIEDVPPNSHLQFDFVASWSSLGGWINKEERWGSANFYTYLLLREGTDAQQLQQQVTQFLDERRAAGDQVRTLDLMPLTDLHLYADLAYALDPTGDIRYVWIFGALAVLVLLVACINYMNLATARAAERGREVGVRKALGATRGQLARQLYGETGLLVVLGLGLSILLARLGLPLLEALSGAPYALSDLPLGLLAGALCGIGLLVSLVAGSYPALLLSGFQPARVLRSALQSGRGRARFRKGLVVFQFAAAVALIASTFAIHKQLSFLQAKKLGFDEEQVVVVPLGDAAQRQNLGALQEAFTQHAGIPSVSTASEYPSDLGATFQVDAEGLPDDRRVLMKGLITDTDIVETLGLKVVAGQSFPRTLPHPDSAETGYRYLLNETAVRTFGWEPREAIGRRFNMLGGREGRVTGVVADFHFASLRESIEPLAIWYHPQQASHLLVRVTSGQVEGGLAFIEEQWAALAPYRPFHYRFLDDAFAALYQGERRVGQVFGLFAALAILIACLGLFGLAAFAAEQRTKEIGVRKVLGASVTSIVALLSKDFAKLVLVAFVVAAPVAWFAMRRWLEDFAYRIELGPGVFLLAGAAALGIALLTVSYQALKAATANPTDALRAE